MNTLHADDGCVDLDLSDFDFTKRPVVKCKHCNKQKGDHRAATFECPKGLKGRAGTITRWGPEVFEAKPQKGGAA